MAGTIQCGHRGRKDFGKIPSIVEIPNLIEVQKRSYETFLQKDTAPERREEVHHLVHHHVVLAPRVPERSRRRRSHRPALESAHDLPGSEEPFLGVGSEGTGDDPLSPRQREVAGLIARGFSNRRVAQELVIGEATVATHVQHILTKLELGSRAQIAVWADRRQLRTNLIAEETL